MVNWGTVTPIVVAIIGISGVVLPAFSSVFINQIYNKPSINIDIPTEPGRDKQIINITNSGTIPATNLTIVITASNHTINNITNLLSTTDVILVNPRPQSLEPQSLETNNPQKINDTQLNLQVKKFANGAGSIIELAIGANETTSKDYVVYAAYDQGSKKGLIEKPERTPLQIINDYIITFLTGFINSGFAYFYLAEIIVLLYVGHRLNRRTKRRFLQRVIKEIRDVRKSLRADPFNKEILLVKPGHSDTAWAQPIRGLRGFLLRRREDKRKKFISENDYTRIDDSYSKLTERNSYIQNNQVIEDFTLAELNRQCLELAEDALTKTDWSKYGLR